MAILGGGAPKGPPLILEPRRGAGLSSPQWRGLGFETASTKLGRAIVDLNASFGPGIPGATFHHVGIACRDLDAEERALGFLGYVREREDFFDPLQGVHGRFLVGGGPRLELLRNASDPGMLTAWLRKGIKMYHLGYEVDDVRHDSDRLRALGAKELGPILPAVAFGGREICFFMLPNLVTIELIAREPALQRAASQPPFRELSNC